MTPFGDKLLRLRHLVANNGTVTATSSHHKVAARSMSHFKHYSNCKPLLNFLSDPNEILLKSHINLRSSSTVNVHSTRMNWALLDTALIELSAQTCWTYLTLQIVLNVSRTCRSCYQVLAEILPAIVAIWVRAWRPSMPSIKFGKRRLEVRKFHYTGSNKTQGLLYRVESLSYLAARRHIQIWSEGHSHPSDVHLIPSNFYRALPWFIGTIIMNLDRMLS